MEAHVGDRQRRNRLAGSASPYLLQHAANPVDWYPWGEEALARARREQLPIFLSIGYAACHWCHVMERESFEDPAVATLLNQGFVPIKVDREERPDIDAVAMAAVQALTGSGGWPLSVFLTPDLQVFFGGTYFPPERRWGRPSFSDVLAAVADAWAHRRGEVLAGATELAAQLAATSQASPVEIDPAAASAQAREALERAYDPRSGGFGGAPKFPTPARLFFLVDLAAAGDPAALTMLTGTLDGMAAGGMWDWVGGGFHRYSVDADWLVPHFEKMLYDNALLARAYGEAGVRCRQSRWVDVARATADYLLREMRGPEGGFYSSTDADSEGEEGRFFTWTADEVSAALPEAQAEVLVRLCDLNGEPTFERGRHVIRPRQTIAEVAKALGRAPADVVSCVEAGRRRLLAARTDRIRPLLDDKRLAGWNGMTVWSLAWLGAALEEPTYLDAAVSAAEFVRRELIPARGPLVRSWRSGTRSGAETLEDVAWVLAGFLELYQASGDHSWVDAASEVVRRRLPHYLDGDGALFDTPDDGESLPLRPREPADGATPASAAVMARGLLRLAALTGDGDLATAATGAVRGDGAIVRRHAASATTLVVAAREAASPASELVIVGDPAWPSTRDLLRVGRGAPRPPLVLAPAPSMPVPAACSAVVSLFAGREHAPAGTALAYLCVAGACELPTSSPEDLAARLAAAGGT